ncbi:hypothetical protein D3C75_426280 [compost metagenome]
MICTTFQKVNKTMRASGPFPKGDTRVQVITINKKYQILNGPCAGIKGRAVGFDSVEDELWLQVDPFTSIVTNSDNVQKTEEQLKLEQEEAD